MSNIFDRINSIASDSRVYGAMYAKPLTDSQAVGWEDDAPKHCNLAEMPFDASEVAFGVLREMMGLMPGDYVAPFDAPDDSAEVETLLDRAAAIDGCEHFSAAVTGPNHSFVMIAPACLELAALQERQTDWAVGVNAWGLEEVIMADDMGREITSDNGKRGGYTRRDSLRMDFLNCGHLDTLARAGARYRRLLDAAKQYPASRKQAEAAKAEYDYLRRNLAACEYGAGYEEELTEEQTRTCRKPGAAFYGNIKQSQFSKDVEAWLDRTYREQLADVKPQPYVAPKYDSFKACLTAVTAKFKPNAKAQLKPELAPLVVGLASEIYAGRRERATLKLADFYCQWRQPKPLPLGSDLETEQAWREAARRTRDGALHDAALKLSRV